MAQICVLTSVLLVFLLITQGAYAKRGCSAFGHSCFGGHGKRSGNTGPIEAEQQEIVNARRQIGQEEIPPHPGYPRSNINGMLASGDDIIPVRDGGVYDREEGAMKELLKSRLRNIVKHWMDNYRRSQNDISADGYYVDTL